MDKTATLRVARGAVWYDGPQYSRLVGRRPRDCSKYSVGSAGFRLVEEVEDPKTTLSVAGSLRVVRGSSAGAQEGALNGRCRAPGNRGYRDAGFRLVEVIDG